jgi:predicted DNA-binding transcriptional regulator AlpA
MEAMYLSPAEAAQRAGVSLQYLMRQCADRTGPAFIRPSPRRTMFRKIDVDTWVASWERFEPINAVKP